MAIVRSPVLAASLFAVLLAAGCSSSSGGGTGGAAGGTGGGDAGTVQQATCANDHRVTAYRTGLTEAAMDGKLKMTFMSANPAPPTRGINAWSIQLTDGSGQPVDGAAMTV